MQEYKKIGIIVADDEEFKPLADLVTRGEFSESYFLKRKILNFKTGKADVYACFCGIGKVNAAAAAAHFVDMGIGYKPCEKPWQEYIYNADKRLNSRILSLLPGAVTGTAVTGDCFVTDDNLRERLKNDFGAVCCDMETAAIAYVCYYAGVPFAAVRRISDDAGAGAGDVYREMNNSGETVLSDFILECARLAAEL